RADRRDSRSEGSARFRPARPCRPYSIQFRDGRQGAGGGRMSRDISPERLGRLDELLDRQDIADCLTRFTRGMDRFDRELFLSAYHDDAIIDAGDFVGSAAQVYDMARELHDEGQSATLHNVLNHACELDGDTAHCETYFFFVGRNRDETNWAAGGRYLDRFE